MLVSNGSLVTKTPVFTNSSYFPSLFPSMSGAWPSAYGAIYRQQLWVYVVVNKLAGGTARLPLPVYKRVENDGRERDSQHPMAQLLANPNPAMSPFDLWFWTSSTRDIFGRAWWYKKRQRGVVTGLYPLHPASMTYDESSQRWTFNNGKLVLRDIPDSDLVDFKHYHPDSDIDALSPLEPLRKTLENEWHARNATSSFWRNGARPGTALSHPGKISTGAASRLKERWDAIAGGSGGTGATVVLEEGMKPEKLTLSAEEAQYIETRKLNREEVCGAYDVPPPAVHILDHATFSNITEQMRSVYRDTQAPRLKSFESTIELELRRVEWPNDDVYAEFLMDEVLRGDFEARQEALAKADYMTYAEKRRIENLPFVPGTDRIFVNAAIAPLPAPPSDEEAPPPPAFQQVGLPALIAAGVITEQDARDLLGIAGDAPGPPEVQPLPETVVRSVLGRLGWQRSMDDIDFRAITKGLDADDAGRLLAACASATSVAEIRDRIRSMSKAG